MTDDRFNYYIERILDHEGHYVFHPNDPGGETKWGISKRTYPDLNIKGLTREQAIEIYRRDFWSQVADAKLDPAMAYQVLDSAINSGMGNTRRFLQRAVGVADDGILGPVSLAYIRAADPTDLVLRFLAERLEFMTKLTVWNTFGKGWARRIAQNLKYASEDN